ncbi:50S ribosomal protein L25 [Candidatus Fermentibacteria bacterium]|nr:50S ribosomal protein L25 [Candidatus Fermentibacteria bacterium]
MPIELTVEKRASRGSAESRRMRREGLVPAVIYGRGGREEALAVREAVFMKTIGHSSPGIVTLNGLGKPVSVLVKEVQWNFLTDRPLHVDFYRVALDQIVSVRVPIHLSGNPKGVLFGGVLDQLMHDLPIKVRAADIPASIPVDVSSLDIGDALHVSDLVLPAGVTADVPGEQPVVHVVAPTVEKVKVEEGEAEAAEGAAAEGEAEEGEATEGAKPGAPAGKKPSEKKEGRE